MRPLSAANTWPAKCDCSLCKVDYRKSAIAVVAGHAVERTARHSKVCRPMGVPATNHMGAGSGRSVQNAELIQFDRHLKKTAPFFANGACLKLACAARKRYSARNGGVEQDDLR